MEDRIFNYQLDDSTVIFTDSIKKDAPYIATKPRNHESLFFVTKGSLLYEKGSFKEIINQGQIGYIARGSVDKSSAHNCESVSYIAINFSFKENTLSSTLPFKTLCAQNFSLKYENLFLKAINIFLLKTPGYMAICNGIIIELIGHLYNGHLSTSDNLMKSKKIEKAMEYLQENYHDPSFKISDLAKISFFSEKQFRRIFLSLYSKTPYAFLQELRLSKAEILLSNTQKSISEIALQCGFSDVYGFSHSFKKAKKLSPQKYRKQGDFYDTQSNLQRFGKY